MYTRPNYNNDGCETKIGTRHEQKRDRLIYSLKEDWRNIELVKSAISDLAVKDSKG